MISREPWPTLGYVRRTFAIYAIVWAAVGGAALLTINFWFAPIGTAIFMLVALVAAAPFAYRRWHARHSVPAAGE